MSDISITPASVKKGSTAQVRHGYLGAASMLAGMLVYKDAAQSDQLKAFDADAAGAGAKVPVGILLNGGGTDQPGAYLSKGLITIGGTVVPGVTYVASGTAGGICPAADLATGDAMVVVGIGISTTQIDVQIQVTGVTL